MKKNHSSHILIGSMLFGLFFGAGNLIFPVHMGQQSGGNLVMATLGFLITGTGLPFLGVVAMGLTNSKNVLEFGSRVHRGFGYVMAVLLYLTIGPMFALPRTATVPFEVGFTLLVPEEYQRVALFIFTIVFFGVALLFALRPTKILDSVGKILNPLFLVFIGFILIKSALSPMGSIQSGAAVGAYQTGAFTKGFLEGYQTMDALAALAFGSIVVDQIKSMGITAPGEIAKSTARSGIVTMLLMCVIYGGLAWLGATSRGIMEISGNGGLALAQISHHYLGKFGSIFLTITITIACLKTAIGLITSCSKAFMEMFPNSLNYISYAIVFSVFSMVVANVGLNQIIALAMPMLMLLYPPATVLILLSLGDKLFGGRRQVYVGATIGSLLIALADGLAALPAFLTSLPLIENILSFYEKYVPFFTVGFGWMIPAIVGAVIGFAIGIMGSRSHTA